MKRSLILFLFIGIAYPQSMQISDSEIRYHGIHPLHEWTGISTSASGKVSYDQSTNSGSITVSVPLNSFDMQGLCTGFKYADPYRSDRFSF